ncbi:hypothetical protein [uncultured Photobacterium sp.]|uniref:hypothetical protein n=1 Tax=uncultured Photobacterium sp. TaxID=173973 RepID=UPI002629F1CD|nr:hypothetical protein [uncultured Photobacterium sp.]
MSIEIESKFINIKQEIKINKKLVKSIIDCKPPKKVLLTEGQIVCPSVYFETIENDYIDTDTGIDFIEDSIVHGYNVVSSKFEENSSEVIITSLHQLSFPTESDITYKDGVITFGHIEPECIMIFKLSNTLSIVDNESNYGDLSCASDIPCPGHFDVSITIENWTL